MYVNILGIDPGPIPGGLRLKIEVPDAGAPRIIRAEAMQVTAGMLIEVLECTHQLGTALDAIAMERYVVGRRAARSSTPAAGARTRDMVGEVTGWATDKRLPVHARSASDVKPWAVDKRLHAAGLLDLTAGMRHARDAARHALFCAVKDYGLPDPMSRKA